MKKGLKGLQVMCMAALLALAAGCGSSAENGGTQAAPRREHGGREQ